STGFLLSIFRSSSASGKSEGELQTAQQIISERMSSGSLLRGEIIAVYALRFSCNLEWRLARSSTTCWAEASSSLTVWRLSSRDARRSRRYFSTSGGGGRLDLVRCLSESMVSC